MGKKEVRLLILMVRDHSVYGTSLKAVLCSQRAELELPVWAITAYTEYENTLFITGGRTPSLVPGRLWLPNTVHERQVPSWLSLSCGLCLSPWLTSELTPWLTGEVEPDGACVRDTRRLVFHLCSLLGYLLEASCMHGFPLRFITCISGTLFLGQEIQIKIYYKTWTHHTSWAVEEDAYFL